ncbi:MAG TPA: FGGY-family carbohydrate kinase [Marmoricola sp.]|nr:FGGY-family carbohydrate kinase [Marmoricola sp.]
MSGPAGGEPAVLAIDLGSSGLKVGVVTLRGRVLAWAHRPLTTRHGAGGSAEQDAAEWWRLVRDGAAECLQQPAAGRRVVAVGVTGQWASTVPVDADGLPVGPCLMWDDTQGARHSRAVVGGPVQGYRPGALVAWVRRTAGVPSPAGADPLGHMLHLQRDRPQVARAARWFLEPVDQLGMRFTGVAAASPASMTAAWLTDNRHPERLEYDASLVARAGIDPARLPPLVRTGSVVAPVAPAVAEELGIAPDAVLVTGLPDLHSATVGSGGVRDFDAHVSLGTTAWVSCPLRAKKTDLLHQMATVPGVTGSGYLLGNNQEAAGRCLEWARSWLVAGESYDDLLALAAAARPGSGGVVFTPWLAGERSPVEDHRARGGFANVSLGTSRADLARAVLEGVALNLRWLVEAADRVVGRRLDPLRIVGGGARSQLWCRIVADVLGRPVLRIADPLLAGLRGMGLVAGVALAEIGWDDVPALVPVADRLDPDPGTRACYDRLFAEFPGLYRRQRRMFGRLNG